MRGTIPEYSSRRLSPYSGNNQKSIFDPRFLDQLVEGQNALKNMRVIQGAKPGLLVGRNSCTLVVPYSTPGAAISGMVFKGEWSHGLTAKAQEVYVVSSGDTEGSYVCVANGTTDDPDVGVGGWVSLSRGHTYGLWL